MAGFQRYRLDFLGGEEVEVAPRAELPKTSFFSVEYPGILRERNDGDVKDAADFSRHPSLSNALRSMSPLPHPYSTPHSALQHIGQIVDRSGKVTLECRLGQACLDNSTVPSESDNSIPPASTNDVYRHALIGDVLEAHNVLLKVTKRIWRKKPKDGRERSAERKEYTAVAMGITRHVARFRNMSDYLYDPGYVDGKERESGKEESTLQALRLHDCMRQMDVAGIRAFQIEEEKEDYEVDMEIADKGTVRVSNIRLPPPPVFDKKDVPFVYGFRQTHTSYLGAFGGPNVVDGSRAMRYISRTRYDGMAPKGISLSSRNVSRRKDRFSFNSLSLICLHFFSFVFQLFERQPMWSRVALLNQFDFDQQRNITNQKQYLSSLCYTIIDGCWRDTLVKFGYDPRESSESRFLQRMTFQNKKRLRKPGQIQNHSELGIADSKHDRLGSVLQQEGEVVEEDPTVDDPQSHIFDGVTSTRIQGSYQLIDVQDELVKPLILQAGDAAIRDRPDKTTGWYTQKQYDKIRLVLQARFHRLAVEGIPAAKEECDAIVAQVDATSSTKAVKTSRAVKKF
ncbi:hypothetical protein CBS101457_001761 [Exobasidium rhododendri]|nr:hypothetical protein CBS101457_001761 [Exobasidium rhododendri]